ncbi:AraC family transcriptional regulator [Hymenobacter defluvii]|nr:AraC family transcriptional regulator [Hymenobacter defluvii]
MLPPAMKAPPVSLLDLRVCPTGRPAEPLRMQRLEALAAHAPGQTRAHQFWLLLYVAGGTGRVCLPTQALTLRPGRLLLLPPGTVLAWDLAPTCRGEAVCFAADYYLAQFARPGLPTDLVPHTRDLPPAGRAEVRQLLAHLARALAEPAGAPATARAYLHLLLTLTLAASSSPDELLAPAPSLGRLAHFGQLLDAHFRTHKTVRAYAAWLHLTPDHLNALCRRQLGHTAHQLIQARVLAEARHLLRHGALSVAEVGYALGFDDASHFGRFFRRHLGCSPRAYQQNPDYGRQNPETGQQTISAGR